MPFSHRFGRSELERYFDRVRLPASSRVFDASPLNAKDQLSYLTLLQQHQLVCVPFENLTLHYSWHKVVNVEIRHLFDKIVNQGRGGYCMELNSFFHVVLLSLGFDAYMAPSRVNEPPKDEKSFGGLSHCLNIVTIGHEGSSETSKAYAVDVGFGATGPCRPCLMENDVAQDHILPAQMRLHHDFLPGAVRRESGKVWHFQHRVDPSANWTTMYAFTALEVLPADIRTMNWSPWQSPTSIFRKTIMCVIFTAQHQVDKDGNLRGNGDLSKTAVADFPAIGDIDGTVIFMGSNMKWRRKGDKIMEQEFKNDKERLGGLEKYLGAFLDPRDQEAIRGSVTELRGA